MRGQVRKRGKSWAVIVYLGRDPATGRKRRKWYTHRTRAEADAHLAQLLVQIQGGGGVPPSRLLTGPFLEQWVHDYAAGAVTERTRRNYQGILRKWVIPHLGQTPLPRLSAQAIQGYLSARQREGRLSPTSLQYHYGLIREALGHAVRWGLLMRNPCEFVTPPRRRQREMRILDEEQVRLFLAEAKRSSPHHLLYLAALLTGMRQGELLALRWRHVDTLLGTIAVQQTLVRLGGEVAFKEPKTPKSRRVVAIAPLLTEALARARGTASRDALVFAQADGKPLHGHNITRRDLQAVLTRAKLPRIRFHDLRHTHASHLLMQGVPVKVVQERLGHATPAVTLGIYAHILPHLQHDAARDLEARLLGVAADARDSRG